MVGWVARGLADIGRTLTIGRRRLGKAIDNDGSGAGRVWHYSAAKTKFENFVRDSAAEGTQLHILKHFPMKSIS